MTDENSNYPVTEPPEMPRQVVTGRLEYGQDAISFETFGGCVKIVFGSRHHDGENVTVIGGKIGTPDRLRWLADAIENA